MTEVAFPVPPSQSVNGLKYIHIAWYDYVRFMVNYAIGFKTMMCALTDVLYHLHAMGSSDSHLA